MRDKILSVVMPAYNEKNTILKIIDKVMKLDMVKELIIVDDGSSDGTRDILNNTKLDPRVKVILHEKNRGKGAALRTGFKAATGDIITVQDADLEYDPNEFIEMAVPIEEGLADVVYGSRLTGGKPQRVHMFWHKIGNTVISFTMNVLFNSTLSDIETCYKMFRKGILERINIRSNDFSVEPELTAKILKDKSLRVFEMPISYYGRTFEEGKKISWKHGFGALWAIFKYRFVD